MKLDNVGFNKIKGNLVTLLSDDYWQNNDEVLKNYESSKDLPEGEQVSSLFQNN